MPHYKLSARPPVKQLPVKADAIGLVLAEAVLAHLAGEGGRRVVLVVAAHVRGEERRLGQRAAARSGIGQGKADRPARVEHARSVAVSAEEIDLSTRRRA